MHTAFLRATVIALGAAWLYGCSPPANPDAGDAGTDATHDIVTPDVASDGSDDASGDGSSDATGALPDLTIDQELLAGNLQFTMKYFRPDACEISEMCVNAPGWRRLLMFTTFTPNVGEADLNLGASSPTNPNFQFSTCHMHYHFQGYADYSLHRMDGMQVAIGHKQSFCVEDLEQVDMSAGIRTTPQFRNCGEAGGRQGISRGWADDYYPNLPCQWIDVTDVPAGTYNVRVALNTMRRFTESNYDNNIVEVPVTIPADYSASTPAAVAALTAACPRSGPFQGMGRNCGWRLEGSHSCTPGNRVSVGCNANCGVGSCSDGSSWDVRVCEGDQPCNSGDAAHLLQNDSGECSTGLYSLPSTCGVAVFTCPASGRYTVLYGPDFAGDSSPGTCTLQTIEAAGDGGVGDGGSDASAGGDGSTGTDAGGGG